VRVGADIGSMCRKCGDTWHVVVAIDAGRIASVECKQCGGRHRFRSPDAPSSSTSGSARKAAAGGARRTAKREKVEFDPSRPIRPYRTTETFAAGDRIDHPKFGVGVVAAISGPSKIQVDFPDTLRVLIHAR